MGGGRGNKLVLGLTPARVIKPGRRVERALRGEKKKCV